MYGMSEMKFFFACLVVLPAASFAVLLWIVGVGSLFIGEWWTSIVAFVCAVPMTWFLVMGLVDAWEISREG